VAPEAVGQCVVLLSSGVDSAVLLGRYLGCPFHLTWSCYLGGSEPCGACGACVERTRAFEDSGLFVAPTV
jgi:7-cyano-7-deazaguanine synthase